MVEEDHVQPGSRPSTRRVTLADVARYAGVSTAVVSYVINDGPRPVAPDTARRVRTAIETLGYRPNSQARALRSGSTGILGMIHPGTRNPFFGEYSDVLYEAATQAGLPLLTASSAGDAATERRLMHDLAGRNVDGLLVITSMTRGDVSDLRDPGVPTVFVNCPFAIPGYHSIGPDAVDGARSVVDHLFEVHNHREVAFVAGKTTATDPEDRELGWRQAVRAHGSGGLSMVRTPFTLDGGYLGARALLAAAPRPTAIFVSSDLQAIGALHAIHDSGLRVPDDVAVVSFDGTTVAAHLWPPLTVVEQPLKAMATAAVATLGNGNSGTHADFPMNLVVRESCGC